MTMHRAWSENEDGGTWATAGMAGTGQIRLMAERMPDGTWKWTTWRGIRFGEFRSCSAWTQEAAYAAVERADLDVSAISHLESRRFQGFLTSFLPSGSAP